MRREIALVVAALVICALAGCAAPAAVATQATASKSASPAALVSAAEPSASSALSQEEQLLFWFFSGDSTRACTPTAWVLADDAAYGLVGKVQYTDEEDNPCNLAFVSQSGGIAPVGLDADGILVVANDSALTYTGDGRVTLSLAKTVGERTVVYDYTVTYTRSEERNSTDFTVSSVERK